VDSNDLVLHLGGPHLEVVSGPNDQYLLLNVMTRDYLKVSKRGYTLLMRSCGLSVGEAIQRMTAEECFPSAQLRSFFDKIVDLGFVVTDPSRQDPTIQGGVKELWLHITDRCNLACPMCYFQSNQTSTGERCMSRDELKRAIGIITSTQPQAVIVSGGEPLLRRDLPELLGDLKEHGQYVWLLTNGTLLTPEICRQLAKSVNRISISLDGATAAVHDKMRGKGSFAAVLRGIRMLQVEGFDRIGIIPTIRRDNVSEIFGLDDFAKELHVSIDSRCLFAARGSAASCRDEYEISVADLIQAAREEIRCRLRQGYDFQQASGCSQSIVDFVQPQLQRCGAGRQKLSIDVNGDLYPCQLLHEDRFLLGNILDFSNLNQLICEANARQVARFTADRIDNVDKCRGCDVRHFCGGGCVVSNVADGLPLDQCPSYCSAMQKSYRVAVWEWRSNCSKKENLVSLLDKLCQTETAVPG